MPRPRSLSATAVAGLPVLVASLLALSGATGAGVAVAAPGCPAAVAHRGSSDLAPEQTLPALVSAARSGAAAIEWDLAWTRSSVPVLMHDATVDRTTDGTGRVSSFWLYQLRELDAGSWFAPAYAGARVPTLAEALSAVAPTPEVLALPELKGTVPDARLRTVVDTVRRTSNGMVGRVVVQSFRADNLRRLRALAPSLPLALTTDAKPLDPVTAVRDAGATFWLPRASTLTSDDVMAAHAAEITVIPWTVNDPAGWTRMRELGVDGLLTGQPARYVGWSHATCGTTGARRLSAKPTADPP